MKIWEIILLAVGLAMDAFAVATCRGLEMKKFSVRHAILIALFFGVFQAGMPLLGWAVGIQFSGYIEAYDHWIAFGLLSCLGVKMIVDSFKKEDVGEGTESTLNIKQLLLMSVATSIDALAVGITFALMKFERFLNVLPPVSIIGGVTFILSFSGVFIGNRIGLKFKNKAELIGGTVLILIGVKILLEHLGAISF